MSSAQPKIADRFRAALRLRGYSYRTEQAYLQWYVRYVRFHKLRHPAEMGEPEVEAFLSHLATDLEVAASARNQASAPPEAVAMLKAWPTDARPRTPR